MVHDINDEDEQLDALKNWWKRYGTTLCVVILLAMAAFFGWNTWQRHKAYEYNQASQLYDQLDEMTNNFTVLNSQQRAQVNQLADQLVNNYGNTRYADLARLIEARVAIQANDNGTATASLQDLISRSHDSFMTTLAHIDLARVQINNKQYDQALSSLPKEVPHTLSVLLNSVRGDALVGLKRFPDARKAYEQALQDAQKYKLPNYGIQLKLDDLAPQEAS
ncbi:hypothetical protein LMG33818_002143 [Halomonadaceae bacterium LMG 33818]|uniref:YfgM family protein n=1 Tax=Cernens ardua TaxID=3402176 RepID=UPI003EDB7A94